LKEKISKFRDLSISDTEIQELLKLKNSKSWKLSEVRKRLAKDQNWQSKITKIIYRPFDERYFINHSELVDRPRNEIMKHMTNSNLALLISRQQASPGYSHVFITDMISESCVVSNKTKEGNYHFPLYLHVSCEEKLTNLRLEIVKNFEKLYKKPPKAEDILYYVYAILHSPNYRSRYKDLLLYDFPRVPITSNEELFNKLSKYGSKLVSLHLFKTQNKNLITNFVGNGNNIVLHINRDSYINESLAINKTQYFKGITEEIYNFQIGCYRICEKWLKDRKNKILTDSDIKYYHMIINVIKSTLTLMKEIDNEILKYTEWPLR
jgi:predicted helicase